MVNFKFNRFIKGTPIFYKLFLYHQVPIHFHFSLQSILYSSI